MKKLLILLSMFLIPGLVPGLHAQSGGLGGGIYTNAARRIAGKGAASLPATCAVGDVFVPSGAPILLNLCTAANTWTTIPASGGTYLAGNGSAAAPSYSFTNSPTTGLFRSAADVIGFSTAGTERWDINASGDLNPAANNTYSIGNGLVQPKDINLTRNLSLFNGTSTDFWSLATLDSSGNVLVKSATPAPGAATGALAGAGAGNVNNGTHSYKVTFVTAGGETPPSAKSNVVTVADLTTNGKVTVSAIPTGNRFVTSRKLYRTVAGDTGSWLLLTTIADNTTTSYTDNTADSGLGAAAPGANANTAIDTRLTVANSGTTTAPAIVIGTGTSRQALDVYPASSGTEIHFSATDVDSGGYLTSTAANQFIVSGGALLTGGNWVAKATSASLLQAAGGFFTVYGDTGLVAGNSFTPTQLFQITSAGHLVVEGVTTTGATGTGKLVLDTAPTLGAVTATSLNGNTFTTGTYTLTGTAAKTLNFQNSLTLAGTDGTTMTFPPNSSSIPGRVAVVDLTTQGGAIGSTSLYAVPANGVGVYRACWVATVTRAATTSSTLGGTAGFQLTYTDNDDSVVKTTAAAGAPSAGVNQAYSQTNQGNTTATQASGCVAVFAKASTTINYLFGYTSSGATTMQYNLHIRLYYEQ